MTAVGLRSSSRQADLHRSHRASLAPARIWDRARIAVTIALITAIVGLVVTTGADADWLAALGRAIGAGRPASAAGVPFAAAPTALWANPLVLAELIFGLLTRAGAAGLTWAQLACVAAGLGILAADARRIEAPARRASSGAVVIVLGTVSVGAFPAFAIARVQMFSLVLFPALLALLRSQANGPSRRVWLALPLLALWGNLHGAALSGLVVLYTYLIIARARTCKRGRDRLEALAIALLAPLALCLNPAGLRALDYYRGLVTNLAAQRGVGQWAPLGSTPLHSAAIAAALLLVAMIAGGWRRERPRAWELALAAILAVLTVKAGRDGVWLLFALAVPAARAGAKATLANRSTTGRTWNGLVPLGAITAVALLIAAASGSPHRTGASTAALHQALRLARGAPILADAIPAEQLALAGGRIYAGNPLDAFSRATQAAYLDWLAGSRGGQALLANPRIRIVVAPPGSAAAALTAADRDFKTAGGDATEIVFERRQ